MERELLGGLDLDDDSSGGDVNRLVGDLNDEFDINENQHIPINIASNSRDTSMISASGASSSQQSNV